MKNKKLLLGVGIGALVLVLVGGLVANNSGLFQGKVRNTSKVKIAPTNTDYDRDGLTNQQELWIQTDPFDPDTDRDGVRDGAEIEQGRHPRVNGSNPGDDLPNNSDWDYEWDGLRTGYERQIGTDPLNPDTDGDGVGDKDEADRAALQAANGGVSVSVNGALYDPLDPCKPSISNSACIQVQR